MKRLTKDAAIELLQERLVESRLVGVTRPQVGSGTFASRLYAKLNRPLSAKYQDHLGVYGWRKRIGLKQFESHLNGYDSIAVSAVDGGLANFLALDVDRAFERRLPVIADVLKKRRLDRASFAVNGSGPGRGKVVVTLRERLPQRQAVRLIQQIVDDVSDDTRFGVCQAKDLTFFPQLGDGGHVRLFGRNVKRVRTRVLTEAPLDLNGDLSDLLGTAARN